MNEFLDNYNQNKKDFAKINKKDALYFVQEMIERMSKEEHDPFFYGHALAKLETYFSPPLSPKKDPFDWAIQALDPKDKSRNRNYVKYGVLLPGVGLCCSDSKRLHILTECETPNIILDCNKNWWSLNDIGETGFNWYPDAARILAGKKDAQKVEAEVIDIKTIGIGDKKIKRKYYNQAIAGMKNPVILSEDDFRTPVYIEDGNRLAAIMPLAS